MLYGKLADKFDRSLDDTSSIPYSDTKVETNPSAEDQVNKKEAERLKRILLLIVAVTVHNIPEGLAVGVAFGSIGKSASATFESARSLAIGIGIQNFPEGLAVSLPLKTAGFSAAKSIWYGQV